MFQESSVLQIARKVNEISKKVESQEDRKILEDASRLIVSQKEFNDDLRELLNKQ